MAPSRHGFRLVTTSTQGCAASALVPSEAMLVWINGPFGGGKTATAYELNRRLPGSVVCDPEHVGFGMRRMLPAPLRRNFQDLRVWRSAVRDLLHLTLTEYNGPVIVPMTLVNPAYSQEIIGGLRADGFDVRHFALLAQPATVKRRLRRRSLGREKWAIKALDESLRQLHRPEFAEHIHTDNQTVAQVADAIAKSAGLSITPSTDGRLRASVRRYAITLRHIRRD